MKGSSPVLTLSQLICKHHNCKSRLEESPFDQVRKLPTKYYELVSHFRDTFLKLF